jgi:hypothetical protein
MEQYIKQTHHVLKLKFLCLALTELTIKTQDSLYFNKIKASSFLS